MNKKSFIPIIIFISIAIGFILGRSIYKSKNIFYSQNNDFKKLQTIIDIVENNYVDQINVFEFLREELVKKISSIDPYTNFYTEEEYKIYKDKIDGEYFGIGITYQNLNDTIRITNVFENSPAEKAGLKKLDAILALNNTDLVALSADSMSKIISINSKTLYFRVKDFITNNIKQVKLKKDKIEINPITFFNLNDTTAYIKINSFQKNTFKFFKEAEKQLLSNHKISSIILDLRYNGGGILEASVNVANEFLEKGDTIVLTQSNSSKKETYTANGKGLFIDDELIILVNYQTASAAELVTLAMQDNDRALIIGTKTYGKGVFQQDLPVLDKNIAHITTGKYFGPSGRNINLNNSFDSTKTYRTKKGRIVFGNNGITPDLICDKIDFSDVINEFDFLFIPLIDNNKKQILKSSNVGNLYQEMKSINPTENNTYLNYLSSNSKYFEKIKFLSVAKFIFTNNKYSELLLNYDYCLNNSLKILENSDIETQILKIDTLQPIRNVSAE